MAEFNIHNIKVTKRDGHQEPIQLDKIHRVLDWAAEGLDNVSVSQVELKSHIQFYDGIRTEDIHLMLIKSAADLISTEAPDYQYMAARLAIFHLRKIAYGQFTPPKFYDHIKRLTEMKRYDHEILEDYSKEEIDLLDEYIDHWRDMNFSYAGVKQLEGKYLVQDRVTKQVFESPQFLYMLVGMVLFSKYPKETRLDYVKKFYDAASLFKISLPTPIMGGVRTPTRQFSSCVLIECADNLNSINATASAIVKYVAQKAGIGINGGAIRAVNSPVRGGELSHTGCIPFFKHFQTAVKSVAQGGIRGGAATLYYPIWHLEVESFLVLKNNRGVEENRIRQMDYGVQINKLMYQRLINGEEITLFSPSDVDGLYKAFFADQDRFEELYLKYENDPNIRKKRVKAVELFSTLMQERSSTGRIYIQNVDHCNTHSAFNVDKSLIKQSNLCLEITLPTAPLEFINEDVGEIALCTLAAVNLGKLDNLDELEVLGDLLVRALDALLSYQRYPVKAAEKALKRRALGIGVVNYAYYLAKNGVRYSDGSANAITHQLFEALQYYLLKSSNQLAKEQGACEWFGDTTYAQGILPIDTYKKDIDKFSHEPLHYDWESLRKDIQEYGLRNSTLTAIAPTETSSQISNATNGIEPPRGLISVKASKEGILKQVVPDYKHLKYQYETLLDMPNMEGYFQLVAIMQKFVDQAISTNTNYDPKRFDGGKVPMKVLLKDLLTAYKYGLKTLYYHNTRDGADDRQTEIIAEDDGCAGGACKI